MNKDAKKLPGNLSLDEIKNGCIVLAGEDDKEEQKLCMIKEEFRNGIDNIKNITPSVTFYGSTRINEGNPVYERIQKLAYRISKELNYAVITGGGPGAMEAANHGAHDAGGRSLGLTIRLPQEQYSNPYITEEIPFEFFFTRQIAMSYVTEVCIFCPGGFGTLYELFEILTNLQTGKMGNIPVILYLSEFWNPLQKVIMEVMLEKYKTVNDKDVSLFKIIDDDDEILEIVRNSKMRGAEDSLK